MHKNIRILYITLSLKLRKCQEDSECTLIQVTVNIVNVREKTYN